MKKTNTVAIGTTGAINLALAALLTTGLLGPVAQAQAQRFRGLSIGLGVASADSTVERDTSVARTASNTDTNGVLQLQYNLAAGDSFLVGFGASANLSDLNAGTIGALGHTIKNGYSLYVAPGYAFNDSWAGYAKLAYLNANLQNTSGFSQNFDNGFGYGLGAQVLFDRNWFGQVEYMVDRYPDRMPNSGTTLKLKSNIFSLTAGYRF